MHKKNYIYKTYNKAENANLYIFLIKPRMNSFAFIKIFVILVDLEIMQFFDRTLSIYFIIYVCFKSTAV